jgi:hypothetical protein
MVLQARHYTTRRRFLQTVRATWDGNPIKVQTDAGLYGIGEGYRGWGAKDLDWWAKAHLAPGESWWG